LREQELDAREKAMDTRHLPQPDQETIELTFEEQDEEEEESVTPPFKLASFTGDSQVIGPPTGSIELTFEERGEENDSNFLLNSDFIDKQEEVSFDMNKMLDSADPSFESS
jgi:hypothetical protein